MKEKQTRSFSEREALAVLNFKVRLQVMSENMGLKELDARVKIVLRRVRVLTQYERSGAEQREA